MLAQVKFLVADPFLKIDRNMKWIVNARLTLVLKNWKKIHFSTPGVVKSLLAAWSNGLL